MNDTAKQAKKKMTGTRAAQKRMSSMAILSALFGLMGGYGMGSGSGHRSHVSLRGSAKKNRSPELVEAMIYKAQLKRERRRGRNLVASMHNAPWQPHPTNPGFPRDDKGRFIQPAWASQRNYKNQWERMVASNV